MERELQLCAQVARRRLDEGLRKYETTVFQQKDRENFEAFKANAATYQQLQQRILPLVADRKALQAAEAMRAELERAFEKARAAQGK